MGVGTVYVNNAIYFCFLKNMSIFVLHYIYYVN